MNILCMNSASRGLGGNERSLLLIANLLSNEHLVVLAYRKEEIGSHAQVQKYRLPFLFEGDIYTLFRLAAIVRKHKIDLIISSKRKDYAIAGIVCRICGIKNILWLGAMRKLKNNLLNKMVYSCLADGIIVNARQIKETLQGNEWLSRQRIKVLYRGIDSRVLDEILRHTKKEERAALKITAMGRLDTNKSYDILLHGMARFLSLEPEANVELTILGEGDERNTLESLIRKLHLDRQVKMPGFSNNPYPILVQSDIFVMTSKSEGLSTALIEAMYLGNAPVSTYSGGGVLELIVNEKNGFLYNHGDIESLASLLQKLYLDPNLRRRIGSAAAESVAEKYALDRVRHEMNAFCQEITADT